MPTVEDRDSPEARPLSPEESLAIIERTLSDTRRALGFTNWVFYAVWGVVWLVCFGLTHLVASGPDAPLARLGWETVGLVWLAGLAAAIAVTIAYTVRHTRGLAGRSARAGRRMAIIWLVAFPAAGTLGALLELAPHQSSALFVFVLGLLYLAIGATIADDLMLGLGLYFLVLSLGAVAVGPSLANLVMSLLGGGGLLAGAALAWRRDLAPRG